MSFYRIDLHVHSPASRCFSGNEASPSEIIAVAKRTKLDAIAVTDHHSFEGFSELAKLGAANKILVLPGVELTCSLGGVDEVFILGVFDPCTSLVKLENMLIELDIPKNVFGSGGFVISRHVSDVINKIRALGGIAISSRVDKTEYRRAAIQGLIELGINVFDLVCPDLAVENFGKYEEYRAGKLRFLTFSDSHEAKNTGSRFSEIELPFLEYAYFVEKLSKN